MKRLWIQLASYVMFATGATIAAAGTLNITLQLIIIERKLGIDEDPGLPLIVAHFIMLTCAAALWIVVIALLYDLIRQARIIRNQQKEQLNE